MDFFDVIKQRYTHKEKFLGTPVPREHLEKIAKAGLDAPNANNCQCVSLVIIDDKEVLSKLCAIAATDGLRTAPAAIAVLSDPSHFEGAQDLNREDVAAAVENMLLAATALGYVSVWLDYMLLDKEVQQAYLKVLGAPETFMAPVILPIGKPDGEGSRRVKKPYNEKMWINRYKG